MATHTQIETVPPFDPCLFSRLYLWHEKHPCLPPNITQPVPFKLVICLISVCELWLFVSYNHYNPSTVNPHKNPLSL